MKYNKLFLENVSPIKSTLTLSCIMSQNGQNTTILGHYTLKGWLLFLTAPIIGGSQH